VPLFSVLLSPPYWVFMNLNVNYAVSFFTNAGIDGKSSITFNAVLGAVSMAFLATRHASLDTF
jgi:hypothetical protein